MQIKQHAQADYIINKAMVKRRESAWSILVAHHAPSIWPPYLIDLALTSAQSMRDITFQRLCDGAVRLNSKGAVDSLSLQMASLDPAQHLLLGWCKQRVLAWRSRHSLRNNFETEEVMCRLRELVIAKSEHYQPHRHCGDCILTHGYEAWLTWLSKGLFSSLDRSLRGLPSCSLDKAITDDHVEILHDIIADPRISSDTECIRSIRDGLRAALRTPDEWNLFFALMYSGKSLRKIVAACPSMISNGRAVWYRPQERQ